MFRKRTLVKLATLAMLAVVSVSGYAQQNHAIRVNVPFDFNANGTVLRQGTYDISQAWSVNPKVLFVRNIDTNRQAVLVQTTFGDSDGHTRLLFRRYGDEYFLTAVAMKDHEYDVVVPRIKSQLANNNSGTVVALSGD
jgi:hypothetical protein